MNTTNKAGEVQKISTAFWEANFSMIFSCGRSDSTRKRARSDVRDVRQQERPPALAVGSHLV